MCDGCPNPIALDQLYRIEEIEGEILSFHVEFKCLDKFLRKKGIGYVSAATINDYRR